VNNSFSSPLIGRLDDIVVFKPLNADVKLKIVDKYIDAFKDRVLASENHVALPYIRLSVGAKQRILDIASAEYGARGIKRVISNYVEDEIFALAMEGKLNYVSELRIDLEGDSFAFFTDVAEDNYQTGHLSTEQIAIQEEEMEQNQEEKARRTFTHNS
jgi:ATP-dependent Clp protease ATP-binding subunit ClpA